MTLQQKMMLAANLRCFIIRLLKMSLTEFPFAPFLRVSQESIGTPVEL